MGVASFKLLNSVDLFKRQPANGAKATLRFTEAASLTCPLKPQAKEEAGKIRMSKQCGRFLVSLLLLACSIANAPLHWRGTESPRSGIEPYRTKAVGGEYAVLCTLRESDLLALDSGPYWSLVYARKFVECCVINVH